MWQHKVWVGNLKEKGAKARSDSSKVKRVVSLEQKHHDLELSMSCKSNKTFNSSGNK